ncbi:MAG TPA: ROK family transcriptional regulator [Mesotoga infera]|uniref:ROK family transcriptional regulator n=1 Tax=Mesotoga infera TaxID=1236046 RepID=A0A7C1H985_9BACT|nr:ROK family transcriptional regulator [Mesotoga infera]
MKKKASKELMKDINFRVILRKIFENGEISRASLAKTTGLSAATVSKIVSEQMDAGIVSEVGSEISTGGRKPILLSINPSFKIVFGVKIGLGYINLVITDLNGKLLLSGIEQTEPQIRPEKVVELVAGSLDRMRRSLAMPADRLLGIGLAVSGVVDPVAGIVRNSFLLEWEDVPIRQLIEQRVGAKTYVMNDVDSFSLAQMWKGKARNYRNAVFITLGSGVGGAIFLEGNLYSSRGGTGEIGHMTVVKDGRKCTCGSRGCLEAEASFEALANDIWKFSKTREVQRLYEEMKRTESSELEFIREALRIEGSMDEAFRNYSEIIGIALKNVVNIFAPEYILIGGEALEFKDHYLKESIEICKVNSFGRIVQGVTFDIDEMGELAWVLGAVYRVIEDTLFTVSTSLTGEVLE